MAPRIASSGAARVFAGAVVLGAVFAPASPALAQTATATERAQRLFDEGRELLKEERYSEACAKLAESQTLDPGGGTLLNLGICRRREGRSATAFALLTDALVEARAAGRADRIATAERNLAELEPTLSLFVLVPPAQGLPPNTSVAVDGSQLSSNAMSAPLPLDPGEHELTLSAPGYAPFTTKFALGPNADTVHVSVPALARLPEPAPQTPLAMPALPPSASELATPPVPPRPALVPDARAPVLPLAYALLAGGGVSLAAGTYFGIDAFNQRAASDRHYQAGHCLTDSCVVAWRDAQKAALLADVTLGVGAVAAAAGFYLWFGRPHERAAARVELRVGASDGGAFASASGRF